jgi:hypothetical protein
MKRILIATFAIASFAYHTVIAQTVPLNTAGLDDYMRRQQLLGILDGNVSFSIRPLHPVHAFERQVGYDLDSSFVDLDRERLNRYFGKNNKGYMVAMPMSIRSQFNSQYAFGINDGSMIPNTGWQHVLRAGFFATYGKFSLQLAPEVLLAENRPYLGFPLEHESTILYYYEYLNRIDMPERFGEKAYKRFFPGQSSFRFNITGLSFGVSTENLWWGPGKRASLLLSNHAPGFLHFTANTLKPIETNIGSFEGQLIAGNLEASGFLPPHSDFTFLRNQAYVPKRENGNRYLAGLIFSYQPKWVEGFTIGYGSTSQVYWEDMDRFTDYLPVFNGEKGSRNIFNPIRDKRQQFSTGFFRWISQEGHFEFYGEFGNHGNSRTASDFIVTPERNRGFTFGFSNLMPLKKPGTFFQIGAEMTQTGQTIRESIRNLDTWYIHDHVRHGYTHRGQVLGMGYGPAANVNWIELAWVKDFNKISFQFERIVYNNDFYYYRFEDTKDWRNKYVDLVPTLEVDWRVQNFLFNVRTNYVNTLNYKWFLENQPDLYFVPGLDRKNLVVQLGLTYILK